MRCLLRRATSLGRSISYRAGLDVIEALTRRDPTNTLWQSDFMGSLASIGEVQQAQGDLAGALKSYNDYLAIAERLAKSDPGNAGRQRDLSVSLTRSATSRWHRDTSPAR